MRKLMKKYLLAVLLGLGAVTVSNAAVGKTKFTDLQCTNLTVTGTLTNAGCSCTNTSFASTVTFDKGIASSTGTFTGAVSVSTMSVSGTTGFRLLGAFITPGTDAGVAGALAYASSYVLYVGTGTGVGAWVKVGGQ